MNQSTMTESAGQGRANPARPEQRPGRSRPRQEPSGDDDAVTEEEDIDDTDPTLDTELYDEEDDDMV